MKLLEYEAKELLKNAHVNVPSSTLVAVNKPVSAISLPAVLKSQVPIGGRGKSGGIKIVETVEQVIPAIDRLFKLDIKGYFPTRLLAEEKLSIKNEYYLSLLIDRQTAEIRLIAHKNGGVEVEENPADTYLQLVVGSWDMVDGRASEQWDVIGQSLADYYDLPDQTFALQDLVERLLTCFTENDAILIEINPLILTDDNKLVAGDCKMELDDSAGFRHDWQFEAKSAEVNFVTLDEQGTIATIANGAGLAMATVDAVHDYGMSPANFLDIGGGANTESLLKAFKRIGQYPNIQAIVINIFAGITRCDEVARAIIAAKKQIADLPPLCIRLAGTNFDEAAELLKAENISILATLDECLVAAKSELTS